MSSEFQINQMKFRIDYKAMARYKLNKDSKKGQEKIMIQTTIIIPRELRDAIVEHAYANRMTMSEFAQRCLAQGLGRPDLAEIPRSLPGRRLKRPEPQEAQP